MAAVSSETMDRGGTDALKAHFENCSQCEIRQTRRGWFQELFCGCQAKSEFKYFVMSGGDGDKSKATATQVAHSLEDSACLSRYCCHPCYHWKMQVNEVNTGAEILTVDRPCQCCAAACKCCCYQQAFVTSGGQSMGRIQEKCYFCVPSFDLFDAQDNHVYTIHNPTCCCGGCCVNCCAEGNPCGKGCCKVPFWIFPADQVFTLSFIYWSSFNPHDPIRNVTHLAQRVSLTKRSILLLSRFCCLLNLLCVSTTQNGKDATYVGKILKKKKSMMTEIFTDANAFAVDFPDNVTIDQKAALIGTTIFFNSLFFENEGDD